MTLMIGIPKEIKTLEKRVGLTPAGVKRLIQAGHTVFVQRGAGEDSGFSDSDYELAGSRLIETADELYAKVQMVLKVKEPLPSEFKYFRPGMVLFSFLHLAAPSACDLVKALRDRGVTALAFETLEKGGQRPILNPMSEIAGALASLFAGYLLKLELLKPGGIGNECESSFSEFNIKADFEKIGNRYPDVVPGLSSPAESIIFGGGYAGTAAAEYALQIGGSVIVVEKDKFRCTQLAEMFHAASSRFRVTTLDALEEARLQSAKVWIGSVHQTGRRALQVIDRNQMAVLCRAHPKIIMDISIDQGGNFPEALPTSYEDPLYRDSWGNVRFCVPNMPSLAGRYASEILTTLLLPYVKALSGGYDSAVKICPELKTALNVAEGEVLLESIQSAHQL